MQHRFSILLAEDDDDDRLLFMDAIQSIGINFDARVGIVFDGGQLMSRLLDNDKELPDILFLDLNMPCKNGMECLQEIRSNEKLQHLMVVVFTTSSNQRYVDTAFEAGANLYIEKPSNFNELTRTLEKVLSLDWRKYQPHPPKAKFVWGHYKKAVVNRE
jgi:CheY-like chemotaxis protein